MNPKMIMIISILAVQTILWIFWSITVPSYYELLDNAVYVSDFEKGKELIQSHKECFKVYAENRVVDCPTSGVTLVINVVAMQSWMIISNITSKKYI